MHQHRDQWHRTLAREIQWGKDDTAVTAFLGVIVIALLCTAAALTFFG